MPRFAPRTHLETHEVTNQPPDFAGLNLYLSDIAMREAALREGGAALDARLSTLGAILGSEEVLCLGEQANRYPPELVTFDPQGRRIDEVNFHPAYHELMTLAMDHEIHSIAWKGGHAPHVTHASLLALFSEAEQGTMCPISMTYASVAALAHEPEVAAKWTPKILEGRYDAPLRPFEEKRGVTLGMAMTEKQGGSDVRANTTRAEPVSGKGGRGERYRLFGHKWFCSAPMSDAFLTLAYAPGGLSCFLVPRITDARERNAIYIMRLKDKLGNRSNASSEIEYHGADAILLGEEGRGIATIIDMVHHTRLDTMAATLGIMRMALAQAAHHVQSRRAFQRVLIDQPLMRAVIADLQIEYEAAVALTFRVARAFGGADADEKALARLGVAAGKFWLTKRCANFVYECMECLGGVGYVEERPLARLYREAPLNAIWEGSGNVIALDILRTIERAPDALTACTAEIDKARGLIGAFDKAADALEGHIAAARSNEAAARFLAERLALILQASALIQGAPGDIAEAFCLTRLDNQNGRCFGTLPQGTNIDLLAGRACHQER